VNAWPQETSAARRRVVESLILPRMVCCGLTVRWLDAGGVVCEQNEEEVLFSSAMFLDAQ
jgi:hypothetical protein